MLAYNGADLVRVVPGDNGEIQDHHADAPLADFKDDGLGKERSITVWTGRCSPAPLPARCVPNGGVMSIIAAPALSRLVSCMIFPFDAKGVKAQKRLGVGQRLWCNGRINGILADLERIQVVTRTCALFGLRKNKVPISVICNSPKTYARIQQGPS